MHRRHFVASSLAAAAATLHPDLAASQSPVPETTKPSREFYHLRKYELQMGPQTALAETFFNDALVPALARMQLGPVGAFKLDIGPETPAFYVLVPGSSMEPVATLDTRLAQDEIFLKAAQPFWGAPASSPAYTRVESSLLLAFEGWPKLVSPASSTTKAKRIFQLRTYESPSHAAHVRKVEMFNNGEFDIFQRTGLHPVFFGDTLIGPRMPSLTYMLTFRDTAELETNWAAFSADPAWKKLSTSPRYAYESIVSNISNLILSPLAASQI